MTHDKTTPIGFTSLTTAILSLAFLMSCTDDAPLEADTSTGSETAGDGDGDTGDGDGDTGDGDGDGNVCPDVVIEGELPIMLMGTNVGAGDNVDPSCVGDSSGEELTFTWIAPADGTYRFDTIGSDYDTVLSVQDGACVGGMEIGCNDDFFELQSMVSVNLVMGQEVTITLDAFDIEENGNYVLNINSVDCPDFIDLGSMVPHEELGNVPPGPGVLGGSCGGADGPEAAFLWTAPADGVYTFSTAGSTYDTVLYIYDGPTCGGFEYDCNDDAMDQTSEIMVGAVEGQVLFIVVDSFLAEGGDFALNITAG